MKDHTEKHFRYKKALLKRLLAAEEEILRKHSSDEEDSSLDEKSSDSDSNEKEESENELPPPLGRRARKRRKSDEINFEDEYEKTLDTDEPEKKIKHLLPIKSDGKLIRRRQIIQDADNLDEEINETTIDAADEPSEEPAKPKKRSDRDLTQPVSTVELLSWRENALTKCRYKIGVLASTLLEDPQENIANLKLLNQMLKEYRPEISVSVKKLLSVSLTEIFKDILPAYTIKQHEQAKYHFKLKKEVAQLQSFETSLLKQYREFLAAIEKLAGVFRRKRGDTRVFTKQVLGLGLVALNCMCDLLVTRPDFNYSNNIAKLIIPYLNNPRIHVRAAAAKCIRQVFKEDKKGEITLYIVRQINQYVKTRISAVQCEVVSVFLSIRLKDVNLAEEQEILRKDKKKEAKRQMLISMSKKERKAKKRLKQLEHELLETKAEESKEEKQKTLTEVTKVIFTIYFKVLKNAPTSRLLSATLEGITKFAHTINLEFYQDLIYVLCRLIDLYDIGIHDRLLSVETVFTILSGYGEALNIDPIKFYTHLYKIILTIHLGHTNKETELLLKVFNLVLISQRKRLSQQRLLAFTKRIGALALQLSHNGSLGCLAIIKNVLQFNKFADVLLELDTSFGQGLYLPESEEPEYCNAASTALFELSALRRHYHPTVRKMAHHITINVPTVGEGSLPPDISKLSSLELFNAFDPSQMVFKPAIPTPSSKVKIKAKPHLWRNKELEQISENILTKDFSSSEIDYFRSVKCKVNKIENGL